jgi:hypothetical protein
MVNKKKDSSNSKMKTRLTKQQFIEICHSSCKSFIPSSFDTENDVLLLYNKLYRNICLHYELNEILETQGKFSDLHLCKWNLLQLVEWTKSENFDCLKISAEIFNSLFLRKVCSPQLLPMRKSAQQ